MPDSTAFAERSPHAVVQPIPTAAIAEGLLGQHIQHTNGTAGNTADRVLRVAEPHPPPFEPVRNVDPTHHAQVPGVPRSGVGQHEALLRLDHGDLLSDLPR
jgi:hypothetical protein